MSSLTFKPEDTALIAVDLQEKLIPAMIEPERILERSNKMIRCAKLLNVPVFATRQYPKGLGDTIDVIKNVLNEDNPFLIKQHFLHIVKKC